MSPKNISTNNLFATLYLTGATVGHHQTDIHVQRSEEVQSILEQLGLEASDYVSESDTSPVFRVDTALVNDRWEDAWETDGVPVRFASHAEAQRALADHVNDLRLAEMDGADFSEFRIVREPPGHVTFLEIPLALSKEHSALTVALADKLSAKRSPPHSPVGAMNIIREMTDKHPDVDPQRLGVLVEALDHTLPDDMKGAAIISLATILLDGNAEKLNESIKELSEESVYPRTVRERAGQLHEFVENASESMTHDAMLSASKIIPPEAGPAPEPEVAPAPHRPGPTPSL